MAMKQYVITGTGRSHDNDNMANVARPDYLFCCNVEITYPK